MNTTDANFKPTPGPWKRSANTSETLSTDDAIYHRHSSGALKWVCRVYGEGCSSRNVQERDSNAALIAAAPELLEALENIIHPLENGWKVDDMSERIGDAINAIAKAKGAR